MNGDVLPQIGGWAAYIVAFGLFVFYGSMALRNSRKSKHESTSAPLTDAATANAALSDTLGLTQKALRSERAENRAKDRRIDQLEQRCEDLHEQLVAQRERHDDQLRQAREEADREIRSLQEQVNQVTFQLGELRRRLGGLGHDESESSIPGA